MMHPNLRQTIFSIEKLKNAVNVGSCSAYQIYMNPGKPLGHIGIIFNPALPSAANDAELPVEPDHNTITETRVSWLSKTLAFLRR